MSSGTCLVFNTHSDLRIGRILKSHLTTANSIRAILFGWSHVRPEPTLSFGFQTWWIWRAFLSFQRGSPFLATSCQFLSLRQCFWRRETQMYSCFSDYRKRSRCVLLLNGKHPYDLRTRRVRMQTLFHLQDPLVFKKLWAVASNAHSQPLPTRL